MNRVGSGNPSQPITAPNQQPESDVLLGDFSTSRRMLPLAALAIGIGVLATYVAFALLKLIGLFTNLFFFQRFSLAPNTPAQNTLGRSRCSFRSPER